MTDYPIPSRLREIASNLVALARTRPSDNIERSIEDEAEKLREIITEMEQPAAGTHAYDLIAAAEVANVEATTTLIGMVAATVLAKLIEEEGGGRSNIRFSPADMDAMTRNYDMTVEQNEMITVVRIAPRDKEKYQVSGVAAQVEDDTPALPPAEHVEHDRPVWVIRYYTGVAGGAHMAVMEDEAEAKECLFRYFNAGNPEPVIENRMCLHPECPAERCTH